MRPESWIKFILTLESINNRYKEDRWTKIVFIDYEWSHQKRLSKLFYIKDPFLKFLLEKMALNTTRV